MYEEDENQEDSEQENEQEENSEDSNATEPELSYEQKLEKWFAKLETKDGIEFANRYREKYAITKQFSMLLDAEEFDNYWRKLMLDHLEKRQKEDEQLFKATLARLNDIDLRDYELHQKTVEMLEKIEERDRAFNEKIIAGLEKDDKEDSEFQKKLNLIADLKIANEKRKQKS